MMRRDVPLLQRIDWIAIGLVAALALLGWINVQRDGRCGRGAHL